MNTLHPVNNRTPDPEMGVYDDRFVIGTNKRTVVVLNEGSKGNLNAGQIRLSVKIGKKEHYPDAPNRDAIGFPTQNGGISTLTFTFESAREEAISLKFFAHFQAVRNTINFEFVEQTLEIKRID